jgi:protein-disulfide isomerase
VSLIAVLALVSGCGSTVTGIATADPGPATSLTDDGHGAVIGDRGPPITIFVDFLCPYCRAFEQRDGAAITAAVRAHQLTVTYRPLNFLDPGSASKTYSSRAMAAFLAGAKSHAPSSTLLAYLTSLYENQPEEQGSTDLSNGQLADLADKAGLAAGTVGAIRSGTTGIDPVATEAGNLAQLEAAGGTGTPTVVDASNKQVDIDDPGWLRTILGGGHVTG